MILLVHLTKFLCKETKHRLKLIQKAHFMTMHLTTILTPDLYIRSKFFVGTGSEKKIKRQGKVKETTLKKFQIFLSFWLFFCLVFY